jgi:glycosyltransferase involved in cell wall biosynthesis
MKIAVWHNLSSGGGKRALYGHVAGLVARGHQVEAWCPEAADDQYLPLSHLIPEHRLPVRLGASPRGPLGWLNERLQITRLPLLAGMNRHSEICAEAILGGGFDVVLAAPCRFFLVPRLGRFLQGRGIPLCLYLQEPFRSRYEAMPELPWLARLPQPGDSFFLRRWWRLFVDYRRNKRLRADGRREVEDAKRYDLILANSYFSRESILRSYGLDARVCYLGCDTGCFRPLDPRPRRERVVVGLGSMNQIKGVDTAIEAMACLPAPRPPLIWVANLEDPAYRRKMEALAIERQVDFQVRSRIDDNALVDLLNRAGLLLYTSRLEPFGYAPIEASACGLPVVAVAEGGIRETVVDGVNGFLCDRDPKSLARAMNRLLDDPLLTAEFGAAGERMVRQRWSPEQSIDRLESHLSSLVEAKPPAVAS